MNKDEKIEAKLREKNRKEKEKLDRQRQKDLIREEKERRRNSFGYKFKTFIYTIIFAIILIVIAFFGLKYYLNDKLDKLYNEEMSYYLNEGKNLLNDKKFEDSINMFKKVEKESSLYDEAQKYLNTDYATTARCVGSKPDDPDWDMTENEAGFYTKEVAESKREYQSYLATNGWYNIFKNGDTNYTIDWTQMGTITSRNIKVASDDYWVASRNVIIGSTQSGFLVRDVNTSGEFSSRYGGLLTLSSQGTRLILSLSLGFRPVFTLKSDINISGGNGSALTPYTLAP